MRFYSDRASPHDKELKCHWAVYLRMCAQNSTRLTPSSNLPLFPATSCLSAHVMASNAPIPPMPAVARWIRPVIVPRTIYSAGPLSSPLPPSGCAPIWSIKSRRCAGMPYRRSSARPSVTIFALASALRLIFSGQSSSRRSTPTPCCITEKKASRRPTRRICCTSPAGASVLNYAGPTIPSS